MANTYGNTQGHVTRKLVSAPVRVDLWERFTNRADGRGMKIYGALEAAIEDWLTRQDLADFQGRPNTAA